MSQFLKRFLSLALIFCLSFGAFYLFRLWQEGQLWPRSPRDNAQYLAEDYTLAESAPLSRDQVPGLERQNDDMIKLVEKVTPSVVSITTEIVKKERILDPLRGRIFERNRLTGGLGSGVIVSREGHVITNHHVIEGQQKIMVTLHDKRTLPALLINSDPLLDIAVLRIQSDEEFQALKFANSDEVKVGQIAIAVGNPFGLGETITVGRISARDRSLSEGENDMLQTDAAINPGNSGGPLLNYLGEIIGINASIYSADRENPGFQGIGFSIPANVARRTFEHILAKGRQVYGYLGLL
ncbi:MAG: trypsin-like peptidase domain-containing protein, partial [Verrucomicrobiales bacterium]